MRRLFASRPSAPAAESPAPAAESPAPAAKPTDDERFTEADIVTILRAGAAGTPVDELCSAEGIPLKTYETWKAKYSGLSASQIKVRRGRERSSRRTSVAFAALVVVATGGWYAFTRALPPADAVAPPARQAQPKPPVPAQPKPAASATTSAVTAKPAPPAPAPSAAPKVEPKAAPKVEPKPVAADAKPTGALETANARGYSVQVAAVPSADVARALIVELTRGGYPAYVTRTTSDGTLLYRIRVGPFESKDATKAIAQRLESQGHRGAWITAK